MYSVATVKMTQEREYMLYSKKFGVEHGGRGDKKIDMEQQVQKSAPTNLAKLLLLLLEKNLTLIFLCLSTPAALPCPEQKRPDGG